MTNKTFLFLILLFSMLTGCKEDSGYFWGYVEGRYTYIATNYGGILKELHVQRGDEVSKDTVLFELESQPESDEVMQTQAEIETQLSRTESLQADVQMQTLILDRREKLVKQNHIPEEEADTSRFKAIAAKKALLAGLFRVEALRSGKKIAEFKLAQKSLEAPFTGLVHNTYYTEGELVTSGTPIISLLHPDEVKIVFFIPEQLLGNYNLKDIVEFTCSGCSENIQARIDYISDKAEFTPPVIYSNETLAKLVFRVEAKPLLEKPYYTLRLFQPVQILTKKNN